MMKIIIKTWRFDSFSSIWVRNKTLVAYTWPQYKRILAEAKLHGFKTKVWNPIRGSK